MGYSCFGSRMKKKMGFHSTVERMQNICRPINLQIFFFFLTFSGISYFDMNGLPLNFPSIMLPGFYHPNSFSFSITVNTKSVSPRLPQSFVYCLCNHCILE